MGSIHIFYKGTEYLIQYEVRTRVNCGPHRKDTSPENPSPG
jgi:hypothetical protein